MVGCSQQEQQKQPGQTTKSDVLEQPVEITVSAKQTKPTVVEAIVLLKNPNDENLTITFPTSQRFELIVKDDNEKVLYTFSEEQVFTQAIEQERFEALGTRRYEVSIELPASSNPEKIEVSTIRQVEGAAASVTTDQNEIVK